MMHLTRLLFILLLSSGLWSSLAAKTALPEVEVLIEDEKKTNTPSILHDLEIAGNCMAYAYGYAQGYCDAVGGCSNQRYYSKVAEGFSLCAENIQ